MVREKSNKKTTPSSQASADIPETSSHSSLKGRETKDPFDEIVKSTDTSSPPTLDTIVALFRAQNRSMRQCFEERLAEKDAEIKELKERTLKLETKLDEMEQYGRRNSVRISGVAENINITSFVQEKLNIDISNHTDRYHPVGKPRQDGKPRPLLLKLTSHAVKTAIMQKRSQLRGTGCYINEDLTRLRNEIAYNCRLQKKGKKIKDTWTRDGCIFVKLTNDHIKRIATYSELKELTAAIN